MTFRINSNIIRLMRDKANQDGVSLNTLISHVLKRYVEWDVHVENKCGIIPLTKPVAFELFRNLSKNEVVKLARGVGKKAFYDTTLFMMGNVDQNEFIGWFLSLMKNSSASITSRSTSRGVTCYVIKHDMGENWSIYHKAIMEAIFRDFLHKRIKIGMTESTLTIEFEEGN